MARPGRGAGASIIPCGILVGLLDVSMEAMRMECDGLVAAGTFSEVTKFSEGCNVVDATWLYK